MSGLDASIGLLHKTTFTEYRYNQLYVTDRNCLVALVNRILFCLFGSYNCVLRDAAGPISIGEEQAAIRTYNSTKSALLLEQNERTIEAFHRAFVKRSLQLYTFDTTLISASLNEWWKSDLQNKELFKTVYSFPFEKTTQASQSSLENVVALFAQNRDLEAEPLKSAISNYATTLCRQGEEFNLSDYFFYDRLNEDVFEACCANNRSISGEIVVGELDSRHIRLQDCLSLKWAIFQFLPIVQDSDLDTLFLRIFSKECQDVVCGKECRAILNSKSPYSTTTQLMAYFLTSVENVYGQLALSLGQDRGEGVSDIGQLAKAVAFHIFFCIDNAVINTCEERLDKGELPKDEHEELSNFLMAHATFTRTEEEIAATFICKEEEITEQVQDNRRTFLARVERQRLELAQG